MAKRKRKDDDEPVNITPHLLACLFTALLGVVLSNWRVTHAALLTLVAFIVFIGLAVWFSE